MVRSKSSWSTSSQNCLRRMPQRTQARAGRGRGFDRTFEGHWDTSKKACHREPKPKLCLQPVLGKPELGRVLTDETKQRGVPCFTENQPATFNPTPSHVLVASVFFPRQPRNNNFPAVVLQLSHPPNIHALICLCSTTNNCPIVLQQQPRPSKTETCLRVCAWSCWSLALFQMLVNSSGAHRPCFSGSQLTLPATRPSQASATSV